MLQWSTVTLLFLATVASLAGVWNAHVLSDGVIFGSTSASLSLLAFGINLTLWGKQMQCLCGCCADQGK